MLCHISLKQITMSPLTFLPVYFSISYSKYWVCLLWFLLCSAKVDKMLKMESLCVFLLKVKHFVSNIVIISCSTFVVVCTDSKHIFILTKANLDQRRNFRLPAFNFFAVVDYCLCEEKCDFHVQIYCFTCFWYA